MSKYFCVLLSVLLVIFFALGNTGFIIRRISYSSDVWFYNFSYAEHWGKNVIMSLQSISTIPRKIFSLFRKIASFSTVPQGDCYDFSGNGVYLSDINLETMCRVIGFTDGTYLVYVGSGRKSPSYVIFCNNSYLNFEFGQRIDTFTSHWLYGFFGIYKLANIKVYDTKGLNYLYNSDGSIRTIGDYLPDLDLLNTIGVFKDITVLEAEEIIGCEITDNRHGGGGGFF